MYSVQNPQVLTPFPFGEGLGMGQALFGGTGSYPCVPHGWHLEIRRAPSQKPLNGPCILMASMAYCEQVGSCLHDAGVKGEMANL
jgi:hypothetical protein